MKKKEKKKDEFSIQQKGIYGFEGNCKYFQDESLRSITNLNLPFFFFLIKSNKFI